MQNIIDAIEERIWIWSIAWHIYIYPKLIHLKDFIGGIHYCVTVFGTWIFDSNISFALSLTQYKLGYCFINVNEKKLMDDSKKLKGDHL